MKGIIAVNAYAQSCSRQALRLAEELSVRGVDTSVLRVSELGARLCNAKISLGTACDFCLFLDKDKYTARMLELSGIRLFNCARAIRLCDDKMTTHIELAEKGIAMPDTIPGLLCYESSAPLDKAYLDKAEALLGYPIVVKQSYGSLGKGVFKANNRAELESITENIKLEPHLYQKYIASSFGKDIRVIVIGGNVIGAIERRSNGNDFRSNIGLGGSAQNIPVPAEVENTAILAAKILGLDYCGIDFLFGNDGYLLCEVNSNAYFDAFEAATKINVAGIYAEHIIKTLSSQ